MSETTMNAFFKNDDVANLEPMENTTPTEESRVKPYEFRTLGAEDIFPMFSIINKIGINEFKVFLEGDGLKSIPLAFMQNKEGESPITENDMTAMGISVFIEIANILLGNLPKCENEIFKLLSQTSNLSVEQVRKLGLGDFTEMVIDFVKKEEFKDFIKVVSKLFK